MIQQFSPLGGNWYDVFRPYGGPRLCPSCGYDLRATPGRCPECGKVPPPEPAP